MSKSYKEGYWMFLYYPDEKRIFLLFKGVRKGYWPYGTPLQTAIAESMSEYGQNKLRTKNWQSYYIDTVLTKDWKEAEDIAAAHFGVKTWRSLVAEEQL